MPTTITSPDGHQVTPADPLDRMLRRPVSASVLLSGITPDAVTLAGPGNHQLYLDDYALFGAGANPAAQTRSLRAALAKAVALLDERLAVLDQPVCTGQRYDVNPDAPDEGTDLRHDEPCPAHARTSDAAHVLHHGGTYDPQAVAAS